MKVTNIFNSALKLAPAFIGSSMLAVGALSAPANALTSTCPESIIGAVSGSAACEYSDSANQDFLNANPITVNAEAFFSFTDWAFGGKIGENAGYTGSGEGQSGIWNIANVIQDSWSDVMLVFKSGQGTTLTGYLLEDGVTSGTWNSPFLKSVFNFNGQGPRDVSHISVYYREGEVTPPPIEVPEPGVVFGLAMAGAGIVTSRRRKSVSNA